MKKVVLSVLSAASVLFIGADVFAADNLDARKADLSALIIEVYEPEGDSAAPDLSEEEKALLALQFTACKITDEDGAISAVFMESYGCQALIQKMYDQGVNKQTLFNIVNLLKAEKPAKEKPNPPPKH